MLHLSSLPVLSDGQPLRLQGLLDFVLAHLTLNWFNITSLLLLLHGKRSLTLPLLSDGHLLCLQSLLELAQAHLPLKQFNLTGFLLLLPLGLPRLQIGPSGRQRCGLPLAAVLLAIRRRPRWQCAALHLQRLQQLRADPEDLGVIKYDLPAEAVRAIGVQRAHHAVQIGVCNEPIQAHFVSNMQNGLPCRMCSSLSGCHLSLPILSNKPGIQVAECNPRSLR
mmetsp:Transcript_36485/g.96124  ORF Transcript_36485/g.96124 Transcript_36485/m.96124 type:complete len:222 (+) Transcript_36485:951-1616(+)